MTQQSETRSFERFEQYLSKQKEFFPHREGTWLFSQLLQCAKERDQQLRELKRVAREFYHLPQNTKCREELERKLDELGARGGGE